MSHASNSATATDDSNTPAPEGHGPVDDRSVREAVLAELAYSPGIDSERIGVAVQQGAVTLTGDVPTLPMKEAVAMATLRVRGVATIADEVVVHQSGDPHDDADIARDVAAVLVRSVVIPEGSVKATVVNRDVTLIGTLDSDLVRQVARRSVAAVPGVRHVDNQVTLRPSGTVTGEAAQAAIAAALVRLAEVDADHVHVAVEGHCAVLTGTVSSWAESRRAQKAAFACAGITRVDNNLRIGF